MMDPGDQIAERMTEATAARWEAKEKKQRGQFLKGPIPLAWLCVACGLSANALRVAVALQFRKGLDKGGPTVVNRALLERFHVKRKASYHALNELESAGLITVDRRKGRAPRVTIQEVKKRHP